MSDTATIESPVPKPKRKYRRRKATVAKATKPVKGTGEFEGMTATACCDACNLQQCIITGISLCGHPLKGGLQPALMTRGDITARYARAQKLLKHQKVELGVS